MQAEQGPVRHAEGHSQDGRIPESPAPKCLVKHVDMEPELELTGALVCPCGGMPWGDPTLRNAYGAAAATGSCWPGIIYHWLKKALYRIDRHY